MSGGREVRLPMTGSGGVAGSPTSGSGGAPAAEFRVNGDAGGAPSGGSPYEAPATAAVPGLPERPRASSLRLVATLALAGALAGLLIVVVYGWTRPRIEAHQARVLQEAVLEVLGGPVRYETAFLVGGAFTTSPPATADTAALERVYVGYDDADRPVGVAVAGAEPGFQDVIRLLFGYDPASGQLLGMKVLESKETPGLGDKIEKDSAFVAAFGGVATPLAGVKAGRATGAPEEVDMITGATISSRAVIDIINHRLDALRGPLGAWWESGGAPLTAATAGAPGAAAAPDAGAVVARAAAPAPGGSR